MFIELDFPREVLEIGSNGQKGGRYCVRDWAELERYWKGKNGSGNVYFTAYGYRATQQPRNKRVDYNTPIIRHFVMDFDCKDFKQRGADVEFSYMHEQVKRLHRYLLSEDITHFVWFSGGGFHIWVPLSEVHTPSDGLSVARVKEGGRTLLSQWHRKLNLGCNDPTVAFDTSGMIRIPNSYNSKRGCWSIPLESEEILNLTHDEIMEVAQQPRRGYIKHGNNDVVLELPERKNPFKRKIERVNDLPDVTLDDIIVLPCLAQSALGEGNPTHKARFHLASYLAARFRWFFHPEAVDDEEKGKHVERICNIISQQGWVDYNPRITKHQVESIVFGSGGNRGYAAASCSTITHDGLCIGHCPYYDGTVNE
jgi:hypothetical protein|tara:strand:+ start:711 stop:1811 length:1101 start_codon:yes stop_codon:yes gene_type:complete